MNFNLKKSAIYPALKWEASFSFANFIKKISAGFCIWFLLWFFYGLTFGNYGFPFLKFIFSFFILSFEIFLICFLSNKFYINKLCKPDLKDSDNLADFLSKDSARAISISDNILYGILAMKNMERDFIFSRLLINTEEIKSKSSGNPQIFNEVIEESFKIAKSKNRQRIEIWDILSALSKIDPVFKEILIKYELKSEDIENIGWWIDDLNNQERKRKEFWRYENLASYGTLAKSWTAGFTITLDKYSIDLSKMVRGRISEFVGHRNEIDEAERILSRRQNNNVLLIGEPGTGKKNIVYNLAKRSLLGESLDEVDYLRFVQINMTALLAEIENTEEVEATLNILFQEAYSSGNVVLVIDDFHNYVGESSRPGAIDISGVLAPFLQLSRFRFIGITDYEGLHRNIERNSSLLSLFGKVEVAEMNERETLMLLEAIVPSLERKYKKFVSYPAMREVINLTTRYMPAMHFPEKAISMLDETTVYVASATKDKVVLPKHVASVITEKTEIPVGEVEQKEKDKLLNLEDLIHERIINQEEAVKEIASALRRARSNITIRKGPMGAFLFLGPTGVGKTETSKALASIYFGSEEKMIRLDMSEFQNEKDIGRLIGSLESPGLLTSPVNESPFSLVLLDEIEKADVSIRNLFLQVLDEGYITDGMGRKVSFQNTIIIATSNAGYKIILEALEQNTPWQDVKQKLMDYIFAERIFQPEFINRFDGFVVFSPLSKKNLTDIAELMLKGLAKNLKEKGIEFEITEKLKEKIAELGYNPVFGAREMRRVVQEKIENPLASALLGDKIKRGNKISINPDNFEIINN